MLRILVEQAGEVIDDVLFDKRVVAIGRDLTNDVVLRDSRVSSLHLIVKQVGENAQQFRLISQGLNGTVADGVRISGDQLIDRPSVIRIADYEVTLIPLQAHECTVEVGREDFRRIAEPAGRTRRGAESPSSAEQAEFHVVAANGAQCSIQFAESALIGRTPDCDIRLDSTDVSRQHCQVFSSPEGFRLRRLSTVNGLDVNGRPLAIGEACTLRDGDVVGICNFTLTFHVPPRKASRAVDPAVVDAAVNVDLSVHRRPSIAPRAVAFELVGFLGTKTFAKFERELIESVRQRRDVIVDLGYLVGVDAAGIASLARVLAEATEYRTVARLIRCPPRIVDLFHASPIGPNILPHVSRTEESAVKLMRA